MAKKKAENKDKKVNGQNATHVLAARQKAALKELQMLVDARYPLIYLVSHEENRIIELINTLCEEVKNEKALSIWTISQGLYGFRERGRFTNDDETSAPPMVLSKILNRTKNDLPALFILLDFHMYMENATVVRMLRDCASLLMNRNCSVIIIAPELKIPRELEKVVQVIDWPLPGAEEMKAIVDGLAQSNAKNTRVDLKDKDFMDGILSSLQGLTYDEAENILSKSLIKKKTYDIGVITSEKRQIIRKGGFLEYYSADFGMDDLGGVGILKDWIHVRKSFFTKKAQEFGIPYPKGMLLIGIPGCGKSLACKIMANAWQMPLLKFDIGKVFQSLIGSSEGNIRSVVKLAEAIAPCVTGDTLVTLSDGSTIPIEDMYIQNENYSVLGIDNDLKIKEFPVKHVTNRNVDSILNIRSTNGEIRATKDHPFPVMRNGYIEWLKAYELEKGDYIVMPHIKIKNPKSFNPVNLYPGMRDAKGGLRWGRGGFMDAVIPKLPPSSDIEDLYYLLGLIDSDGYFGQKYRIGFVNTNKYLHKQFSKIILNNFGIKTAMNETTSKHSDFINVLNAKPCFNSKCDSKIMYMMMKEIREILPMSSEDNVRAYLSGYADGDGCITTDNRVVFSTSDKENVILIRHLFQRLGLLPPIPSKRKEPNRKTKYNITVTSGAIGLLGLKCRHPVKRKRLKDMNIEKTHSRWYKFPIGNLLKDIRKKSGKTFKDISNETGFSSSIIQNFQNKYHPDRWQLERLANILGGRLSDLVNSDINCTLITDIQEIKGKTSVFDLVLDVDGKTEPNFIGNGFIIHNCVLWLDEVDKSFQGIKSSGMTDSGVTARVFGTLITWLQEKTSPVFVAMTANDVTQLTSTIPEITRKGRLDEIFFINLPNHVEREEIFKIHISKARELHPGRDASKFDIKMLAQKSKQLSGAEIEGAVVNGLCLAFDEKKPLEMSHLLKGIVDIQPIIKTAKEQMKEVLKFANEGRAKFASKQDDDDSDMGAGKRVVGYN